MLETFKTKKENALLLLQYLHEDKKNYEGNWNELAKTFEFDYSDVYPFLQIAKRENIIAQTGTKRKPIYKYIHKHIPNLEMANRILDLAYKNRIINQDKRNKKQKQKQLDNKNIDKQLQIAKDKKKLQVCKREVKTPKIVTLNFLKVLYKNTPIIKSMVGFLAEQQISKSEKQYFSKALFELKIIGNVGNKRNPTYFYIPSTEPDLAMVDLIHKQIKVYFNDLYEYKKDFRKKNKNKSIPPIKEIEAGNLTEFPTIQAVDELIDVMSKLGTPEFITFNDEYYAKFMTECNEKLDFSGIPDDFKLGIISYKNISLKRHGDNPSIPIQISMKCQEVAKK